jgi:hypothetical protein
MDELDDGEKMISLLKAFHLQRGRIVWGRERFILVASKPPVALDVLLIRTIFRLLFLFARGSRGNSLFSLTTFRYYLAVTWPCDVKAAGLIVYS